MAAARRRDPSPDVAIRSLRTQPTATSPRTAAQAPSARTNRRVAGDSGPAGLAARTIRSRPVGRSAQDDGDGAVPTGDAGNGAGGAAGGKGGRGL